MSTQPRIFQSFQLSLEGLLKRKDEQESLHPAKAAIGLVEKLTEMGYTVFTSNESVGGAYKEIIIGKAGTVTHKEDFYKMAALVNLPYNSGPFFRENVPTSRT